MESKAGVGGGTMVDLLHEGTVLRESEIPIDHPDATVRTEQRIRIIPSPKVSQNCLPLTNTSNVNQG